MGSLSGWVGVDLDGTLAEYHGWPSDGGIGLPVPAMVDRVKRWRLELVTVKIFTARVWPLGTNEELMDMERLSQAVEQSRKIKAWCIEHLGEELPVTCFKDYGMLELWDDRAVQVEPNTGNPVGRSTRGLE